MPSDLIICAATELEASLLRPHLRVLITGVGAVNAAISLTRFLEREGARRVVVCGIGGAYPDAFESGLSTGSVVCAESECYGDLGANSQTGFLDMQALGFPLIEGAEPLYNVFPLQIVLRISIPIKHRRQWRCKHSASTKERRENFLMKCTKRFVAGCGWIGRVAQ